MFNWEILLTLIFHSNWSVKGLNGKQNYGIFLLLEPADQTSLVAKRILLLITTIQPDQRGILGIGGFKENSAQFCLHNYQ